MGTRAVTGLLATGAVVVTMASPPPAIGAPGDSGSSAAVVDHRSGVVGWSVEADTPGPRWIRRNRPCAIFAPATTEVSGSPGRVCAVSPRRADVTRPDGTSFRAPFRSRWDGSRLTVVGRQADSGQPPGDYVLTPTCRTAACSGERSQVTLPVQRLVSCIASRPWLVHGGAPDKGRAVALTFDDGPGVNTRTVSRVLGSHSAPGTFFQLGRMVDRDPHRTAQLVRQGHVIGNHSDTHALLSGDERAELTRATRAIRRAGAPRPCLFRAPYGANAPTLVELARDLGMTTVHWDTDPGDWRGLSSEQIVSTTLDQVRPGSILVFHDAGPGHAMVRALPRILSGLAARGYRFLTVPELLDLPVTYR